MRRIAIAAFAVLLAAAARAGEHPEHPSQPKAPAPKPAAASGAFVEDKGLMRAFADAVERYVAESEEAAGSFEAYDEKLDKTWKLKLVRIHRDRIARLGRDKFFACADFKSADGKPRGLDLDFYATKTGDGWSVDEVLIHKLDGHPRFNYDKDNRRVPVKGKKAPPKSKKKAPRKKLERIGGPSGGEHPGGGSSGGEHPEHPR